MIILPILFVITLLMIPILTIIGKDSKSKDSKSKIIFLTEILTIKDLEIRKKKLKLLIEFEPDKNLDDVLKELNDKKITL